MSNFLFRCFQTSPRVHIVHAEQTSFFARFGVHHGAIIHIRAHELIAPPLGVTIFGAHLLKVRASVVKVFQGE